MALGLPPSAFRCGSSSGRSRPMCLRPIVHSTLAPISWSCSRRSCNIHPQIDFHIFQLWSGLALVVHSSWLQGTPGAPLSSFSFWPFEETLWMLCFRRLRWWPVARFCPRCAWEGYFGLRIGAVTGEGCVLDWTLCLGCSLSLGYRYCVEPASLCRCLFWSGCAHLSGLDDACLVTERTSPGRMAHIIQKPLSGYRLSAFLDKLFSNHSHLDPISMICIVSYICSPDIRPNMVTSRFIPAECQPSGSWKHKSHSDEIPWSFQVSS